MDENNGRQASVNRFHHVHASAKRNTRLSERRGVGVLTIDQPGSRSLSSGPFSARSESSPERTLDDETPAPSSCSSVPPFFSWTPPAKSAGSAGPDGAVCTTDDERYAVTVERLSRDRPPAKTSPCPSPSSIFRASLPGRSPRWPHTFGRASASAGAAAVVDASTSEPTRTPAASSSIFSFPCRGPPAPPPPPPPPPPPTFSLLAGVGSLGAAVGAGGRDERRRRLLYSFASAELFARALSLASRRLPAVLEKTPEQCEATLWIAPGGQRRRRRQQRTAAGRQNFNRVPIASSSGERSQLDDARLHLVSVVASVGPPALLEPEQKQQSNNRTAQSISRSCCSRRLRRSASESSIRFETAPFARPRSLSWPLVSHCCCAGSCPPCGHLLVASGTHPDCVPSSDGVPMKKCKSSAVFSDQPAMDGASKRRSFIGDGRSLPVNQPSPDRPARSRSPGVVRDRRAVSADRPLCSSGVPVTPEADPAQSDPRKTTMTKVELLRQLTRRLRPSLSTPTSPPPAPPLPPTAPPTAPALPADARPDPAASLPPIPVAPPRHARQPRKKASAAAKKDSATSTCDLGPLSPPTGATETGPESPKTQQEKRRESLFSPVSPSESCASVSQQSASVNSSVVDLFDDQIHLNFSKLSPSKALMVGTYQQRTIPFRSASFSQVDVGADGAYNRRPRQMSITLKPVTYSIGRDQSRYQSVSLPRRLKLGTPPAAAPESPAAVEDRTPVTAESAKQPPESLTPVREEQTTEAELATPEVGQVAADVQPMEVDPVQTADGRIGDEKVAEVRTGDANLDLSGGYETTEVSVTAEIRLSPVLQSEAENEQKDIKIRSKSFDSGMKPLPVLDLLELNNHLLRLKAAAVAGRDDSALDKLADLEVASRLGLTPAMLLPSEFPSGDERSSGSTPPPAQSDQPADPNQRPAWLRDLLRLQSSRARESNSSLSDEGADSGSSDGNQNSNFLSVPACVHSDSSPSLTVRDVKNKRSPRFDRKRRRHSSSFVVNQKINNTSQPDGQSVQRRMRKSNGARSLTFPLRNSSGSFVIVPSTEEDEKVLFKSWIAQTAALKRPQKQSNQEPSGGNVPADGQDALTAGPAVDERTATPEPTSTFCDAQSDSVAPSENCAQQVNDVKESQSQKNHRLTVSLSVTLEPSTPDPRREAPSFRSVSPCNFSSDAESGAGAAGASVAYSPSPDKSTKSPILPRRYGLKRRPLRGPYGEMLEAEMNKSEFGKLYYSSGGKKAEDLNLMRELVPRLATREAKSISPRPSSPMTPGSAEAGEVKSAVSAVATSRQNSLVSPAKSHSLDDSQLKIGYSNPSTASSTAPSLSSQATPSVLVKRKVSANSVPGVVSEKRFETANHRLSSPSSIDTSKHQIVATHQRTSSSPCQLIQFSTTEGGFTSEDEPELLELTSLCPLPAESRSAPATATATQHPTTPPCAELADESATVKEKPVVRVASIKRIRDTRTHAIGELYDTEVSYVESLQTLVTKYLQPLKSSDNAGLVESGLVDEIFYQIPAILAHHEVFLGELRKRLESWDPMQCVGGVFLETLIKPSVIETYTAFINHWKHAKEAIKSACLAKTAFSKFLETMAREHKGKLALDSLLIMPVQRIPRYELLIKMILKHTIRDHPDYELLAEAQKEVHELALKINCMEREAYGAEQQQATLRELESLVEGLGPGHLAAPERTFIRHDCVTIPSALGTRKERGLFLFSDLLVITSVKRRSTAMRKSSSYTTSGIASTLEANKFKLLMRVPLDDLEVSKSKEENFRRSIKDLEHLEEDLMTLNQITELITTLHTSHPSLDDAVKELSQHIQRQINEKQNALDPQLATIDLAISTQEGTETLSVSFTSSEKRSSWEESFTETKLRLRAMSPDRRPPPEFLSPLPIRKTRAGLQFTCAAPTIHRNPQHLHDVWVCNSDGYVGQVCILSLHPEPNVASCNGVCNARITCIAAIPAALSASETAMKGYLTKKDSKSEGSPQPSVQNQSNETKTSGATKFELESSESSSDSSDDDESGDEDSGASNRCPANSIADEHSTSTSDEVDTTSQATMWLGTEDGCIHIYHCAENIRLKKNRIRIQHNSSVLSLLYLENRVFASLANGEVVVYSRETSGSWNLSEPQSIAVGTILGPVTRMLPVNTYLWCATQNCVKILNTSTLIIEDEFAVSSDSQRSVLSMASNGLGIWVAMQGSAVVRLFHGLTHECVCDVNLAPAVNKMLAGCDDIIRQHKAACLRVTSMLVCRDLLWVGTSAGVLLTIPIPHLTSASSRLPAPPTVTGISHGHTGHVRFLTCVEATPDVHYASRLHHHPTHHRFSLKDKETLVDVISSAAANANRLLVISGGDGYEDFRHTGLSDSVGREDSTNHLLIWQVS